MEIGELISVYRKEAKMTIDELSEKSNVPKGTLNKIIGGITKAPTLDNVKAIASALGKTLDDFDDEPKHFRGLSHEAIKVAKNYEILDPYGKKVINAVIDIELDRIKEAQNAAEENKASDIIYINFAQGSASAGNGNTLFGDLDDEPLAVIANNITEKADFVVKVKGNSMLPEYSDDDIVLVSKQPVDTGDIGLFVINGDGYIKKKGNHELISVNPEYKNIPVKEFDAVYCMGKVIDKLDLNWIAK